MKYYKIPEATIVRLSQYLRYLNRLYKNGTLTTSSGDIANHVNSLSTQVRKDLAYFGEFGVRGVGYDVKELSEQITKILGLTTRWNVVIVGAGNLGKTVCQYNGIRELGFNILAVFDNDIRKIGLKIGEIPIFPITALEDFVQKNNVQIGIVAVPVRSAQDVTDSLVRAKVDAILNFAPTSLNVPYHIKLSSVDIAASLELLTHNISMRDNKTLSEFVV